MVLQVILREAQFRSGLREIGLKIVVASYMALHNLGCNADAEAPRFGAQRDLEVSLIQRREPLPVVIEGRPFSHNVCCDRSRRAWLARSARVSIDRCARAQVDSGGARINAAQPSFAGWSPTRVFSRRVHLDSIQSSWLGGQRGSSAEEARASIRLSTAQASTAGSPPATLAVAACAASSAG